MAAHRAAPADHAAGHRRPRDDQRHDYSLAHLTALSLSPPELVDAAADAGYRYVGLRLTRVTPQEPHYPLATDPALMRTTKVRLAATGIEVLDIELARISPDEDPRDFERFLEAGAELGARHVITQLPDPDRARKIDRFAQLCEMARPLGLTIDLEFPSWTETPDLREAARVLRAADQPNAGILVDLLHFARSGSSVADLRQLPAEWFHFAHVCDAPPGVPPTNEGLIHTARFERLFPGEGGIDVHGILAALPPGSPTRWRSRGRPWSPRWAPRNTPAWPWRRPATTWTPRTPPRPRRDAAPARFSAPRLQQSGGMGEHRLDVGRPAGEQLERLHRLEDVHAAAVQASARRRPGRPAAARCRWAGRRCRPPTGRLRRSESGTGEPGWWAMPDRRGVDDDRSPWPARPAGHPRAGHGDPVGAELRREGVGQLAGLVASSRSTTVSWPAPMVEHGVGDRRPGAAGAELHDPIAGDVGEGALEAAPEAEPVGVVAAGRPPSKTTVLTAPRTRGLAGELVEVLDDRLLERVGDVEPAVSERPGPAQQAGQVVVASGRAPRESMMV